MKKFAFINKENSGLALQVRVMFYSRWALSACALLLISSCGGNEPEPKLFEYYVQANTGSYNEDSCRPTSALYFAQAMKPFQEQIIEKSRGYKVLRSECRFSPQAVRDECFAQYKFSIIVPPDDNGRVDEVMKMNFGVYPVGNVTTRSWGTGNQVIFPPDPPYAGNVSFPPSFTPGYLDCGAP
jgi:hypothetical protein